MVVSCILIYNITSYAHSTFCFQFSFPINYLFRMEMHPVFLPPLETLVSMTTAVVDLPSAVLLHLPLLPTMDVFQGRGTMVMDPPQINKVHLIRAVMGDLIIFLAHIPPPFPLVDLKPTTVVGEGIIRDRVGINSLVGEGIREANMDQDLHLVRDMGDLVLRSLLILVMIILLVVVVVTVMDRMDIQLNMAVVIPTAVLMRMDMHLLHLIRVEITVMYPLSFLLRVRCPMDCIHLRSILEHVEIVTLIWMGHIPRPLIPRNVLVVLNP